MRCMAALASFLASFLASSAVLAAPSANTKEVHKRQNLSCHGDEPYTLVEVHHTKGDTHFYEQRHLPCSKLFVLEPFTCATCNDIYRAVTACINARSVDWTCGSALIFGKEAVRGHAEVPYKEFPGDCAMKRLEKTYSKQQVELAERRCNMPDPPELEERGIVKLVHDRQFRCAYSVQTYFFFNYNIQIGAPYDVSHCDEIESTLSSRCGISWGISGDVSHSTCNDDGSGMYGEGTVGAYDLSFSLFAGDISCVQEVFNDMFPDVQDVTGGFKCNQMGTNEIAAEKADKIDAGEPNNPVEERGLIKLVDDKQFRCDYYGDIFYYNYGVQLGAPYDVYHCLDIESTIADWCLTAPTSGPVEAWQCYDDGSTMYSGGDVGAYDISFSLHPDHTVCIEKVLDEMFADVRGNTGGFKCNFLDLNETTHPPREAKALAKRIDDMPHSDGVDSAAIEQRSADWDVGDYDYKCGRSTSTTTELFHVQIGAPYDLGHCLDLEKSMKLCQDPPASWQCYDDGSPRYYNCDVGAYDIHFGMAPGRQTCVEIVLDNQFAAVARNTGPFSCPPSGPEPPAEASATPSADV